MQGIYIIINNINNKCYIGQSKNIKKRWRNHKSVAFNKNHIDYQLHLYRAMRKYGLDSFEFKILEECDRNKLNEREDYYILKYDSVKSGYNNKIYNQTQWKFTTDELDKITFDLINTSLNNYELSLKYNVTTKTIRNINSGSTWFRSNLSYPLRVKYKNSNGKCAICGNDIGNNKKYCGYECFYKSQYVVDRPSRDKLKHLIYTMTFLKIAEQYGVSDNAIKKWCKHYNLPYKKSEIKLYTFDEWKII